MKTAVCIKQVVTRDWPLRPAESATWVRDDDASFEMNEPDAYALEEALRLKERHGGEVVVCSAGPARISQVIREALARGADRAIHVESDALSAAGADAVAAAAGGGNAGRVVRPGADRAAVRRPGLRPDRSRAGGASRSAARHHHHGGGRRRGGSRPAGEAGAGERLVPVGGHAAAGPAHDPERHQPAPLRHAAGHHGRQAEGDSYGAARRGRVAGAADSGAVRAGEDERHPVHRRSPRRRPRASCVRLLREEARVL